MGELAVAEDGNFAEAPYRQLLEDFARGRKRLSENSDFIGHAVRHAVKIFEWQGEILCKGAIMRDDAENFAPRAVSFEAAAAKTAQRAETECRAADIDFAHDAAADPARAFVRGAAHVLYFTDKFVAGGSAKIVIPAQNFDVGIADACQAHPNQGPRGPEPWKRLVRANKAPVADGEGKHMQREVD